MRFVAPFEQQSTPLVRDVMTKAPLITAPSAIDPDDAVAIFAEHKIEKLPLVDEDGKLRGLITVKDSTRARSTRDATKDDAADCVSVPRSASSATPGERANRPARSRRGRPSSSSTPPTATAPACSTWSAASRPTRRSRGRRHRVGRPPRARAPRRSSTRASTPSRSASDRLDLHHARRRGVSGSRRSPPCVRGLPRAREAGACGHRRRRAAVLGRHREGPRAGADTVMLARSSPAPTSPR